MSRPLVILVLVLLAVTAALFWLASRDAEQPQIRVEKDVPLENLTR